MDKLSMAIIAMEAHVACSNDRLRQAWDIIHAKLVEENGSSHNSAMDEICSDDVCVYCVRPPQCHHCERHHYFKGRKLRQ